MEIVAFVANISIIVTPGFVRTAKVAFIGSNAAIGITADMLARTAPPQSGVTPMDEKKEECGYPYADCRFRDELRDLRGEVKRLRRWVEVMQPVCDAVVDMSRAAEVYRLEPELEQPAPRVRGEIKENGE